MSKPIYLQVEKIIDASLEQVWETVALGFGHVADYNPEIKHSYFDSEVKSGVGTRRHCDFPKKGYIKEEITAWEDLRSFSLKFLESSVPMGILRSTFTFEAQGNQTLIRQEMWYRMKAPMGLLSGLMKGKMRQTLDNGLGGLATYMKQQQQA